ncbi:RHS repeat-associated core domain-containing protein [Akkermansia massiliensis]
MSQISTVRDASGIRECSYDSYGHMTKTLPLEPWKAPFRNNNALGRPAGYRLLLGTRTVQHSHLDYDSKGGMIGMNLEGLKSSFTWRYDPTSGFLNRLTYPNGMVRCNTYHPALNLVTAIGYRKGADGESATGHEYDYDALMRPIQRRDLWDAATPATIRDFTYNSRSELLEDRISRGGSFAYCYDNIGNRKTARELEEEVSYDANDRPVVFTSQDGRTSITCGYDYRGRRFEKKVTVNGAVSSHSRFLYRDYLQVAELDLMQPEPMLIKSYLWDPTDPTATRILMMTCWQENGMKVKEHLYFMHDALKNVTSIFDGQQTRRARYEYAPFGSLLTAKEDMAQENKFRFSCEYADDELGLVYYNYRHLNPADGRWINRDPIQEQGGWNLYAFIRNRINIEVDLLGTIPPTMEVPLESLKFLFHNLL